MLAGKPSASFIGKSCNDGNLILKTERPALNNTNNGVSLGSLPVMKTTGEKVIVHGMQLARWLFFLSNNEMFFKN